MSRSVTDICNEALGELPSSLITSIDDATQPARHCKRLYQPVVDDLIEIHDWDFATTRVALAVVTNTRSGEWGYAYAIPTDLGSPRRLIPDYGTSASGLGIALPRGVVEQMQDEIEFEISDNVLFTHLEDARLEYTRRMTNPANFSSLFSRAVALELAYRLVMPVLGNEKRQAALMQAAELAKQRAIADDINRTKNPDLDFVSAAAASRGASDVEFDAWPYRRA